MNAQNQQVGEVQGDAQFPGLHRELSKIVRCGEGEPVWIEPAEAAAIIAALSARQPVGQEPVGTVHAGNYASGMPWCEVEWHTPQPAGTSLYAAPPAQAVDVGQLQRYDLNDGWDRSRDIGTDKGAHLYEHDDGDWVKWDDVSTLIGSQT